MNSKLTVAKIPYLNSAPFYRNEGEAAGTGAFDWVAVHPKRLGVLARNGEIDAGPVSLMDCFELEDFEPLSNLGIAVRGPARSVLLFSKNPIERLDGARVGLTDQTSTSSELLKLLLREKRGLKASLKTGFSDRDDARLLIGDEALRMKRDAGFLAGFPLVYDLGEEWESWKGLAFVFARWMVKKEADPSSKKILLDLLNRNLDLSRQDLKPVIARHQAGAGWIEPEAEAYLKSFRYRLGAEEAKAVMLFRSLAFKPTLSAI